MANGLDPFVDGHGEDFYFVPGSLRQRLDLAKHLIEFGHQTIILTGPTGSGKSAFAERLVADLQRWDTFLCGAGPTLNRIALLKRICAEFGIDDDGDDPAAMQRAIEKFVSAATHRGAVVAIIVDDADTLPADSAACLMSLASTSDHTAAPKILLTVDASNSAFVNRVQSESGDVSPVHLIEMPRFAADQTADLLRFRWQAAFDDEPFPFESAELINLHHQSNGNPGKALVLARQLQMMESDPTRRRADPAQRYLFIGAAFMVILVVIAVFNGPRTPQDSGTTAPTADSSGTQMLPEDMDVPPPRTTVPIAISLPEEIGGTSEAAHVATGQALEPPAAPLSTEIPPAPPGIPAPDPEINPVPVMRPAPKIEIADIPAANPVPPPEAIPAKKTPPPEAATPTAPTPPEVASTPPQVVAPQTAKPAYSLPWLRARPAGGYVLQLFGVRDKRAAEKFINNRKIGADSVIFESILDNAPWFVVLYGYYPDRQSASTAVAQLPTTLAELKPWPRPIASLQSP